MAASRVSFLCRCRAGEADLTTLVPKFPEPPSAAAWVETSPERRILPSGFLLWRLYFRGGKHPTLWDVFRSYGPTRSRFDHHLPPASLQERSIFYGAEHGSTCLAEVFQESRIIDRASRKPWLVALRLGRDLELLDLTGDWPTRAGASMAINSGPRPRAQRWSRAIYDAFPTVDGLYYSSSMAANRPALALYERAVSAMPSAPAFHRPLSDPALLTLLRNVARDLGYLLL